ILMFRTWWKKTMNPTGHNRNFRRQKTHLRVASYRPRLEALEDRRLLSVTASIIGQPTWLEQGPGPINSSSLVLASPNGSSSGAVESVVAEPTATGYIVYAATVNGGIWRSDNIPAADPTTITWRPLTDNQPTLATCSLALDPNDTSGNTLWVGTGSVSSAGNAGGPSIGLLKTTDGGATWTVLTGNSPL